jgi:hypothetical protein
MMASKRIADLVRALRDPLAATKLDWKETSEQHTFQATVANSVIRVREEPGDRAPDYYLELYKDGRLIDAISDNELSGTMRNAFSTMNDIYSSARGKALGIDQVVGDILKVLGVKGDQWDGGDSNFEDEIPF